MKIHKTIRSKGIEDLAYLDGIIDGEGTIGLYWHKSRNSYRVKIYVVNRIFHYSLNLSLK
jgi:hypothetical protein